MRDSAPPAGYGAAHHLDPTRSSHGKSQGVYDKGQNPRDPALRGEAYPMNVSPYASSSDSDLEAGAGAVPYAEQLSDEENPAYPCYDAHRYHRNISSPSTAPEQRASGAHTMPGRQARPGHTDDGSRAQGRTRQDNQSRDRPSVRTAGMTHYHTEPPAEHAGRYHTSYAPEQADSRDQRGRQPHTSTRQQPYEQMYPPTLSSPPRYSSPQGAPRDALQQSHNAMPGSDDHGSAPHAYLGHSDERAIQ